jgi:FAD/FMN-containing dehydrogenase/Fe-S oxidoreductase
MGATSQTIGQKLRTRISGRVLDDPLHLALYSTDASIYQIRPTCVVLPRDMEDMQATVQFAAESGIPVAARGAGSGLAGESLCSGIVMDTTLLYDRILELDADRGLVTCQAGVVLERLNARLAKLGWQFGPDPASGTRASIGGITANNSTGAHSIKYGYTEAHIESMKVILADGAIVTLRGVPVDRIDALRGSSNRADQLAVAIHDLLAPQQEAIAHRWPKSQRNRSGYNLHRAMQDGSVNLHRLMSGSEGTLAVIGEVTLRLVRRPKVKALVQLHFATMDDAAKAAAAAYLLQPAACELMDATLAGIARKAYPHYAKALPPPDVGASLIVEYDGDTLDEVREKLAKVPPAIDWAVKWHEVTDPAEQKMIWEARKAAVPLLFRMPGKKQPVPFIEDVAVPVDRFPEYIHGLEAILARYGTPVCYFAHAGHGECHTRPYLDLHDPAEVDKMCAIAKETYELVWSLGGTISGEHGEGLSRVAYIQRQYGPLYDLMRRVKTLFDPNNIINPGKIIGDDPDIGRKNLRFHNLARPERTRTKLVFRGDEFVEQIERCNGNGECRTREVGGTMCPIFRVVGEEDASPRAHANMMRHYITGLLEEGLLGSDDFKRCADFCVNCKMCRIECPSGVDVPKLMLEARAQYVARRGLTRAEFTLSRARPMSVLNSYTAPIANFMGRWRPFRVFLEKVAGVDRRRKLPAYEFGSFLWRQGTAEGEKGRRGDAKTRRRPDAEKRQDAGASTPTPLGSARGRKDAGVAPANGPTDRVSYFVDLFANYNDHSLARATMAVLRHNGIDVNLPRQTGCGMPAIDYGDIELGRKDVAYNVEHLLPHVRDGRKIVCSEPTAALCLKEEYLYLDDSPEAHEVAAATHELCSYLLDLHRQGRLKTDLRPVHMHFGYHAPCHVKAMEIGYPGVELVQLIPGVKVTVIERGCCGVAGTYGFQKKNFDISMKAGEGLFEALQAPEIQYGLSECSTCKMQMEQGSGKYCYHPVKVLAMAYGLEF